MDMTPKNPISGQKSLSNIFSFQQMMDEKEIMLVYCGEFSQELNKTLLSFTERKFKADNVEDNTRRKVFNIMVELLQNISKNKVENTDEASESSVFMIGNRNDDFILITSNMIRNDKIPSLKDRLDQVNSLDKEGLKLLYKDVRLNTSLSDSGGAGIGIIDIARKSENKLEYSFKDLNNQFSLFSLLVRISG
jgi:hypothetical protein